MPIQKRKEEKKKRKKERKKQKKKQYLVIRARISGDENSRLNESSLDLIGECSRGVASSDGEGSGVLGEFQDCTLAVLAGRDHTNILRIERLRYENTW